MTKEPFIAHSELTNEIYIVVGKEKYRVTEQAIKAVVAIKALEQEPTAKNYSSELGKTRKNSKKLEKDFGKLDCVSRQAVDGLCWQYLRKETDETIAFYEHFLDLPSVTQIRPKGHWIMTHDYFTGAYESIDYVECSCCHADSLEEGNYCPNCGAEMSEVEE